MSGPEDRYNQDTIAYEMQSTKLEECKVVKVDPVLDRVKTLELRVEQLEVTIERMDGILCAMKHHEHR